MNRYYIDTSQEKKAVRIVDDPHAAITHGQTLYSKTTGEGFTVDWYEVSYKAAADRYFTTDTASGMRRLNHASWQASQPDVMWSPEMEGRAHLISKTNQENTLTLSLEEIFDSFDCTLAWWL